MTDPLIPMLAATATTAVAAPVLTWLASRQVRADYQAKLDRATVAQVVAAAADRTVAEVLVSRLATHSTIPLCWSPDDDRATFAPPPITVTPAEAALLRGYGMPEST